MGEILGRYLPDIAHARGVIADGEPILQVGKAWLSDLLDVLDEARTHCRQRGRRIDHVLMEVALLERHLGGVEQWLIEHSSEPWERVIEKWSSRRARVEILTEDDGDG